MFGCSDSSKIYRNKIISSRLRNFHVWYFVPDMKPILHKFPSQWKTLPALGSPTDVTKIPRTYAFLFCWKLFDMLFTGYLVKSISNFNYLKFLQSLNHQDDAILQYSATCYFQGLNLWIVPWSILTCGELIYGHG